jgi:hypothetical protein
MDKNLGSQLSLLFSLWPVLFVPLTLYGVSQFGNSAGDVLLGALFFYLVVFRSDLRTRKLMITLAVLGMIFETANVAAGLYKYGGILGAPVWIALGWAILGWWVVQLESSLARVERNTWLLIVSVVVAAASFLNGSLSISLPIAVAGLYVISVSSNRPFGVYAFTALFGLVAEFSGTAAGVWKYFAPTGGGAVVPPDLAALALAYASVMAFCSWASGFEPVTQAR